MIVGLHRVVPLVGVGVSDVTLIDHLGHVIGYDVITQTAHTTDVLSHIQVCMKLSSSTACMLITQIIQDFL